MIKVVAKNQIKADKIDEFIKLAVQLVKDTNQYDSGCISYELFQDISNPQIVTFIEEWTDKESLDKHLQAKHFKEAAKLFNDFLEKAGDINLYTKLS